MSFRKLAQLFSHSLVEQGLEIKIFFNKFPTQNKYAYIMQYLANLAMWRKLTHGQLNQEVRNLKLVRIARYNTFLVLVAPHTLYFSEPHICLLRWADFGAKVGINDDL